MTDYMTLVMEETKREALRQHSLDRYYRKVHLNNLISRATMMEERGNHLEQHILQQSYRISIAESVSNMTITAESRHRMAKEIAEELLADKGEQAHLFCLEKLANDTSAPKLWRDVLSFLDEMEVKDGGGMDNSRHGLREEQGACSKDDS